MLNPPSARMEKAFPFLLAALAAGAAALPVFYCGLDTIPQYLPAGTMTLGVVVAGFAATQRNMLLGMRGSTVLRFALRTGYHNDVLAYLMHCVYAGLFTSVVSLAGFFLGKNALLWSLWLIVLTFSIALALALIWRNEILMLRIVKRFMEDEGDRSG